MAFFLVVQLFVSGLDHLDVDTSVVLLSIVVRSRHLLTGLSELKHCFDIGLALQVRGVGLHLGDVALLILAALSTVQCLNSLQCALLLVLESLVDLLEDLMFYLACQSKLLCCL